jgi:hypothetical protein
MTMMRECILGCRDSTWSFPLIYRISCSLDYHLLNKKCGATFSAWFPMKWKWMPSSSFLGVVFFLKRTKI